MNQLLIADKSKFIVWKTCGVRAIRTIYIPQLEWGSEMCWPWTRGNPPPPPIVVQTNGTPGCVLSHYTPGIWHPLLQRQVSFFLALCLFGKEFRS